MARPKLATRLDPIERDFRLVIDELLTPDAQAGLLRQGAADALKEGQDINERALGYVPEHDTFIDGSRREDLSAVRVGSTVIFEFHLLADIIQWVDERLIINSPVGRTRKSPEYAKSHTWFADDIEMDPFNPPPAEQYVVLSTVPYARKIERGLSPRAPDGVYQGVASEAIRRFGNVAYVGFSYASIPGGAVGAWAQTGTARALARTARGGNPRTHTDWLTRQPAIKIDPGRR